MILTSSAVSSSLLSFNRNPSRSTKSETLKKVHGDSAQSCCSCGRRHFIEAAAVSLLPPVVPSIAADLISDSTAMLTKVHPPRPDWYEEFYASVMDTSMKAYEAEIAGYKSQMFSNLRGEAQKVLEIGIGTGPNLKYYARNSDILVFGVDPNTKMEKYAQKAALAAGLPPTNFKFIQAVVEAIPLSDASVDAVVGTLVLCSVEDVSMALKEVKRVLKPGGLYLFVEHVAAKDGTTLRFLQTVLDPLQQKVSDGCHLTRETGKLISEAGFSRLDLNMAFWSNSSLISPHVPHESNVVTGDWSVVTHEPYWRTNSSFSPPLSRQDFHFDSEGQLYGSQDGLQLYGSSTSSNSKESRSWLRGNRISKHQYSASDGAGLFSSSPSDISPGPQWTPPVIQNIDDYETRGRRNNPVFEQISFTPTMEGTSANPDGGGSASSCSDFSESEPTIKSRLSSHCSFSGRHFFMSKPIYPLSFPTQSHTKEVSSPTAADSLEITAATVQRDANRWSNASSSVDFTDVSEQFESEFLGQSCNFVEGFKCGLCEKFLSQRSPWGSRRIVRSGDMPVSSILSCRHVFHAECLEQTTPKTCRNDPPCPLCVRCEEEQPPEVRIFPRLRSGFPKYRQPCEDGLSRPWGCGQMGDCVEGALQAPPRNTMLLVNRNHIKKNFSLKGDSSKEYPGKLRKSALSSSQLLIGKSVDQGAVGCSNTMPGPRMRR